MLDGIPKSPNYVAPLGYDNNKAQNTGDADKHAQTLAAKESTTQVVQLAVETTKGVGNEAVPNDAKQKTNPVKLKDQSWYYNPEIVNKK